MPTYKFTGTTQQLNVNHPNKIVALKVDLNANPPIVVLDETTAAADGTFTLTWADWAGRVMVGAVDDDPTIKLDCVFRDFVTIEAAAGIYNLTQSPSAPVFDLTTVLASTFYSEIVLLDSPLAYYKLDETSGTVATDSSGNERHGTYVGADIDFNAPAITNTATGSAFFNSYVGASSLSEVITGNPVTWGLANTITLEGWFINDAAAGSERMISRGSSSFRLRLDTLDKFPYWELTGIGNVTSPVEMVPGDIYHVVGTYDGATIRLYMNGVEVASTPATGTIADNGQDLYIAGELAVAASGRWNGNSNHVAIYNYALTPAQIMNHYEAGTIDFRDLSFAELINSNYIRDVGFYRMDSIAGGVLTDSNSNINHGTIVGSPSLGGPIHRQSSGSITFASNGQYASIPPDAVLDQWNAMIFWVTPNALTANATYVSRGDVGVATDYFAVYCDASQRLRMTGSSALDDFGSVNRTLTVGRRHCIMVIRQGRARWMYMNGLLLDYALTDEDGPQSRGLGSPLIIGNANNSGVYDRPAEADIGDVVFIRGAIDKYIPAYLIYEGYRNDAVCQWDFRTSLYKLVDHNTKPAMEMEINPDNGLELKGFDVDPTGGYWNILSTKALTGKRYWEISAVNISGSLVAAWGVADGLLTSGPDPRTDHPVIAGFRRDGTIYSGGVVLGITGPVINPGDLLMLAYDANTGTLWYGVNGVWQTGNPSSGISTIPSIPTSSPIYAHTELRSNANHHVANFGATTFTYVPPTGFIGID